MSFLLPVFCVVLSHPVSRLVQPHEATDVQAVNDFILFSIASVGSLIGGLIFSKYGWEAMVYAAMGMVSEGVSGSCPWQHDS